VRRITPPRNPPKRAAPGPSLAYFSGGGTALFQPRIDLLDLVLRAHSLQRHDPLVLRARAAAQVRSRTRRGYALRRRPTAPSVSLGMSSTST